jgi:hypothetical protein
MLTRKVEPSQSTVKTISSTGSIFELHVDQSRAFMPTFTPNMILPFFLSAALWMNFSGVYTQMTEQMGLFKKGSTFKPSEIQALNIKLDYGTSPEPQRSNRREKISLKLTQITKTITEGTE